METLTFPHGGPESDEKKHAGVGGHGWQQMDGGPGTQTLMSSLLLPTSAGASLVLYYTAPVG